MSSDLILTETGSATVAADGKLVVPAIIADAGDRAAKRFLEYFAVTIRNRNTRQAYLHAVRRFFAWCERERIGQLVAMLAMRASCSTAFPSPASSGQRTEHPMK